ncbi:DNA-binding response regulator [Adhaeribacter aerolatus]|uniref:DNA-binding response regulator n=1 Tax=Adhaeribacter aerolatus TaxID=670289 RepID=A0A512ATY7_9BACT|nr:LytTR family DNA-binding domain-containing protein [Adhaeribacter aerolatus]GEO03037.1 DNA-binding response regulator [Adhaeribacter aerolatus]
MPGTGNSENISIKTLIIDDDPFSAKVLEKFVGNTEFLELVGICNSSLEAAKFLRTQPVDLLLLDVEMPEMSGLDLLSTLNREAMVIMVSASREYAVEAFEQSVIDYLVKPVSYPRFLIAAQKALDKVKLTSQTAATDFTFVKVEQKLVKIPFADIFYIEALGDYVHIVANNKKTIVYATMKSIENKFPSNKFIRVHRSFIVNLDKIGSIEDNNIMIGDKYIPIGATYMKGILQLLNRF